MREAKQRAGALVPEYHRPTPECPHPERWSMYDSMTAEVEVLEFLRTLVTTTKPNLVVETGTFLGVSTLWIAEALRINGFGRIVSCEYDPQVFATAKEKIRHLRVSRPDRFAQRIESGDESRRHHRSVLQRQRHADPRAGGTPLTCRRFRPSGSS